MTILIGATDITDYIAQGYTYEREPQYGDQITALDGTDYSVKLRDKVKLTLPFVPLTGTELSEILQLFPDSDAYVEVTYDDLYLGLPRIVSMKYSTRSSVLSCSHRSGVNYYSGLVIELIER